MARPVAPAGADAGRVIRRGAPAGGHRPGPAHQPPSAADGRAPDGPGPAEQTGHPAVPGTAAGQPGAAGALRIPLTVEVARLADHIVMMDQGRVVAQGPLQETLAHTDHPFRLKENAGVILKGKIIEVDTRWHLCRLAFDGGELWLRHHDHLSEGMTVRVQVLARDISLALEENPVQSIQNLLPACIDQIDTEVTPGTSLVRLGAGPTAFLARLTTRSLHQLQLEQGQQVWMQIKSVALMD